MSTGSTTPWWQISLKITGVIVLLALLAASAPWPLNGAAVLGAVVLLVLSLHNPEHWPDHGHERDRAGNANHAFSVGP